MRHFYAIIAFSSSLIACSTSVWYDGDSGGGSSVYVVVDAGTDTGVGGAGGSGGEWGNGGNGGSLPHGLPWGAPCDVDLDCESGACIPSPSTFGSGSCYGHDMVGCIKVGKPSSTLDQCVGSVYVCGDDWPMSNMGECHEVAVGAIDESYQCCIGAGVH